MITDPAQGNPSPLARPREEVEKIAKFNETL